MAWYAWMQVTGGEEAWSLILAEQRERTVRDRKPAFTTILDADNDFRGEMSAEDMAKVHYRGPFYVDFDASSLDEVIPQFQRFLTKLKDEHQFDLHQASLFASGGKGFHVLIPQQCFLTKPAVRGTLNLPHIYREMALETFVDTLDLRVYTARRGRMFRTANVERPDKPGVHKVPITVEEAFNMTPELYRKLCAKPRHIEPPAPAELNANLALLYSTSHDKVDKAIKSRKNAKVDEKLLKRFGGDVPPSILSIMSGETVAKDVGFQKIATQLAITAHALGKSEEEFLTLCAGLCEKHQSDGTRYNTQEKRRRELARMWQYMHQNPCYAFSVGGVKSLVASDVKTPDLDDGGVEVDHEEETEHEELDHSISQGVRVNARGIFRKTEEGLVKICAVGITAPKQLKDVLTEEVVGYEVDVHVDGRKKGSQLLRMDTFTSRNRFMQFTLASGGSSMNATDLQVGAIADILRTRSAKSGNHVYTTNREGIDLIRLPDGELDVIWADRDQVVSRLGVNYRLTGQLTYDGEYQTDLFRAPPLLDSEDSREFFDRFFNINKPEVLGRLFGWYLACFFAQPIRYIFRQFPSLQVFGPAGSGKSKSNELMVRLHYFNNEPVMQSALAGTPFSLEALASGSASIPFVIDEFKPREMRKDRLDKLKSILRDNYTGLDITKGWKNADSGQTRFDLKKVKNLAPIVTIGEAIENQTAIQDRCVLVPLTKDGKRGHATDFLHCMANRHHLSGLGRLCLDRGLNVNLDGLSRTVSKHFAEVAASVGARADDNDRPVFNLAVILTGLKLGDMVLTEVFGDRYKAKMEEIREAIMGNVDYLIPRNMSEASKVLDTMAYLSRAEEEEKNRLVFGRDYIVAHGVLELHLKNAYFKYTRFKRTLGEEVLYDTVDAFIVAMQNYTGVKDRTCLDSELKDHISTQVFGIDIAYLTNEGVAEFKS